MFWWSIFGTTAIAIKLLMGYFGMIYKSSIELVIDACMDINITRQSFYYILSFLDKIQVFCWALQLCQTKCCFLSGKKTFDSFWLCWVWSNWFWLLLQFYLWINLTWNFWLNPAFLHLVWCGTFGILSKPVSVWCLLGVCLVSQTVSKPMEYRSIGTK